MGYFYSGADIPSIGMPKLISFLRALLDRVRGRFRPPDSGDSPAPSAALSPAVRQFILEGHSAQVRADLERQIEEFAGLRSFTLKYPGGYYQIENGQIVGSGRFE